MRTDDPKGLQRRLYDEHRIEVPVTTRTPEPLLRVSFQGYNDESDLERLLDTLPRIES